MQRTADIDAFLASTGLDIETHQVIAGDASNRRYFRVFMADGTTAILMDAPPEKGEDTAPFLQIADHLSDCGLSAPKTFAKDTDKGLLLIEDFGDTLFDRHVLNHPNDEEKIYLQAWSALKRISITPAPDLPPYDSADMADKAGLIADWYDPNLNRNTVVTAMQQALGALDWSHMTLALRDFHAQNLIWLPDRKGAAQVGLLDFQDAQPGHILYDLVSLIYDARREVSPGVQNTLLKAAKSDTDLPDFDAAIATLLAQRSLRILGVFARLWLRDGKPSYLKLIPRVYGQLEIALIHPALTDVANALSKMERPTDEYLATLRAKR
ncbi:MAG: aminoglycoside phosphotransferase family protein [Planktomarina sp.]